ILNFIVDTNFTINPIALSQNPLFQYSSIPIGAEPLTCFLYSVSFVTEFFLNTIMGCSKKCLKLKVPKMPKFKDGNWLTKRSIPESWFILKFSSL
ncbi:MAG: hypothetical protein WBI57_06970, partial [Desulfobacterales bacterium]